MWDLHVLNLLVRYVPQMLDPIELRESPSQDLDVFDIFLNLFLNNFSSVAGHIFVFEEATAIMLTQVHSKHKL